MDVPETRYAQSGDLSIAYQTFGAGDLDLVFVPGFISHCDMSWQTPYFRGIYTSLSNFARVITFDKRGTGLSDRSLGLGTPEDRMDDIRAVMDAAASERAAVVGISEGGPLALLFAATYPERVSALALWGTYARVLDAPDYPIGVDVSASERLIRAVGNRWGTGDGLRLFVERMPDDPEMSALIARYERATTTPTMVQEILRRNTEIDARGALSAISAPTLVVHRTGDLIVPVACGKYVADNIEGGRFVELPGDWHMNGSVGGEEDTLAIIEEFLTGSRHEPEPDIDRVLKTVLFTDIVGSTERAAAEGDRRWRELLDRHDAMIRVQLDRFRGEEIAITGDGFLAAFDGPGRAINCARTISTQARSVGLEVRAGLHTGECERRGENLAGIAVHIGARVAGLADAGEVLVTSTVRDLVAGSDIQFGDRGLHQLKGVPGEWQVLAVRN